MKNRKAIAFTPNRVANSVAVWFHHYGRPLPTRRTPRDHRAHQIFDGMRPIHGDRCECLGRMVRLVERPEHRDPIRQQILPGYQVLRAAECGGICAKDSHRRRRWSWNAQAIRLVSIGSLRALRAQGGVSANDRASDEGSRRIRSLMCAWRPAFYVATSSQRRVANQFNDGQIYGHVHPGCHGNPCDIHDRRRGSRRSNVG
jgi:hypothetical protein